MLGKIIRGALFFGVVKSLWIGLVLCGNCLSTIVVSCNDSLDYPLWVAALFLCNIIFYKFV